jgi:hypothetical protein
MPGVHAPAASCAKWSKAHELVTTVAPVSPGIPARDSFNGYFVLSPVIGLFVTVAPRKLASRELDAGVEASGPHDFSVRRCAVRPRKRFALRAHPRPPHPEPYVRDDRETPLCVGRDGQGCRGDLGKKRTGIFLPAGMDRIF